MTIKTMEEMSILNMVREEDEEPGDDRFDPMGRARFDGRDD